MHGPHLPAPGHRTLPPLLSRAGWNHTALWDTAQELCLRVCPQLGIRGPWDGLHPKCVVRVGRERGQCCPSFQKCLHTHQGQ